MHTPTRHPQARTERAPIALVTGASSGIGAALARAYAERGWRLVLVGRRPDALQDTALACAHAQGWQSVDPDRIRVLAADLQQSAAWCEQAGALLHAWGCPQVVIANAGISHGVDLSHQDDLVQAREVMGINWLGALATLSPFITPMRARGSGTLVGIASVAGVRGLPGHAAYSASKAALISSLESLRVELRGSGVKVLTLSPGYIATPMTAGNPFPMPFIIEPDDFARRALRAIDAGRAYATIPWPMAVASKLLHILPRTWYDPILAGQGRKPRKSRT